MQEIRSLLVLGGCRSGKSRYAETWINARFRRKLFLATLAAAGNDQEMAKRIALHRDRRDASWQTAEEPLQLATALDRYRHDADVILVDCLSMWISNCLLAGMSDEAIEEAVAELAATVQKLTVPVVLVANEVGLGLVPDNQLGRRFRDLAGLTNQQLATACDAVVFVAAGLPITLKS
ncbi:MAG: bifunctional adenosylcobinamide kinase/adenosylcobinamide-phosphate guanylyltransferase [Desulfobulbaceae bacterium]|nr:bifunctional adenosylcobinamide kinase/adenosylcobinamide-phosphate guanylyltransferase [Desulfobulbaceae bacterium]